MSGGRRVVFLIAVIGLAALFCAGFLGLNPYGHYSGVYGTAVNAIVVGERHATDAVSAVNFDIRGIDTLGEEFILFASIVGVALLLRPQPDEQKKEDRSSRPSDDASKSREAPPTSEAVRVLGVALVSLTVVFGGYVVSHGVPTPGGGFQGGVVLATAPLVVYLSTEAKTFIAIAPESIVKASEALGAGAYVLIGALAFVHGLSFLTNVLPLGTPGDALSGGTLFALNVGVGLEVAAGFVVLLLAFVEENLKKRAEAGK